MTNRRIRALSLCFTLAGCPPADSTTAEPETTGSTGSAGATSDMNESTGGATQADPTAPTSTSGSTGESTTGESTTGESTTGGEQGLGDARVFYLQRGTEYGLVRALRYVEVVGGVASAPVTVFAGSEGGPNITVTMEEQGRWFAIEGSGVDKGRMWVVDTAGPTVSEVELPPGLDVVAFYSFSHDGTRMALGAGAEGMGLNLYVCTLGAGGACTPELIGPPDLGVERHVNEASFSPDDSRMMYSVYLPGDGSALMLGELAKPGVAVELAAYTNKWTDFGLRKDVPATKTVYYSADISANNAYEFFAVDGATDVPGAPVPISPPLGDGGGRGRMSLDGSSLLWWSGAEQFGDLWRIPLAGTKAGAPELLNTTGPGHAFHAHFVYVDGERVMFLADHESPGTRELYLAGSDGAAPVKLNGPFEPIGHVSRPHLSPTSTSVLYFAPDTLVGQKEAYVVDLAAPGQAVKINAPLPPEGTLRSDFAWSGDGELVLFAGSQEVAGVTELFLVDLRDGTPKPPVKLNGPLPPGGRVDFEKHFASDARRVFFTADRAVDEPALYMVGLGADVVPTPPVELSATDEIVDEVFVLPPN